MKLDCLACLIQFLSITFLLSQPAVSQLNPTPRVTSVHASQPSRATQGKVLDTYGKLPLSFEANDGQVDARVKFISRGGTTLFLMEDEAVLVPPHQKKDKSSPGRLGMKLHNANPSPVMTGVDRLPGTSNYFIGDDSGKWRTDVPTYAKVKYEGVYSGINLVFYGNQRQFEYDFIVGPGADPHNIAFDITGARRISRNKHGELVFTMGANENEIRWRKPLVYQRKANGAREKISAHYAVANNRVGFELAKYDSSKPLFIDPVIFSTFLGGGGSDFGGGIAVDSGGNIYVAGATTSTNFPTMNPLQPANHTTAGYSAFITKINATGTALVYSTYLGGSGNDFASAIAVDSAGNVYISGQATSTDFPTKNPLQATNHGTVNAFVSKLNPEGSALVYSTYLGGSSSDSASGIAIDSAGRAFVTGSTSSADFPRKNPVQATHGGGYYDAFAAKLNIAGSALLYSTFLGGSGEDDGYGIALDSSGNAYITGVTDSSNFPTKGAFQSAYGGGEHDAFVTMLNTTGSFVYSTYLGGSGYDRANGIAIDSAGSAYVTGYTTSADFPVTPGVLDPSCLPYCAYGDTFVTKFNPSGGALVYSTYFRDVGGYAIALDSLGYAYVTGQAYASLSKLNPAGSEMTYSVDPGIDSTHVSQSAGAAIAVDSSGTAYIAGTTDEKFPTVNALQPVFGGDANDAFVSKVFYATSNIQLISSANPAISGQLVRFTATVASPSGGTPSGTITFDVPNVGLEKIKLVGGLATFATRAIPVGVESVTARYGGDSNFSGSRSPTLSQVVIEATTTTLSSSPNPSAYRQSVTFSAVVNSSMGAPPDGEIVTFQQGAVLGTGTISGGAATFTTSALTAGRHSITAVYGGDANFGGSSSNTSQIVNKDTTSTKLTSSLNPSSFGQSVTFTATVTPQYSGTIAGTVTFNDGSTVLKTQPLTGGVAKFTTSSLAAGSHTVSATYNGSTNFDGSSASLMQTVR